MPACIKLQSEMLIQYKSQTCLSNCPATTMSPLRHVARVKEPILANPSKSIAQSRTRWKMAHFVRARR
jgi:hypothetical protein